MQTQIRLFIEEQSDQGLHCLPFHLHVFDKIPSGFASLCELHQRILGPKIYELYGIAKLVL